MIVLILSALSLGFLGSFHCIGMCGPIALTLPVQHLNGWRKMTGILLYNIGRISAYALMGMLFGWLGRQFYLGWMQQWLSIGLGGLLLMMVLLQYMGKGVIPNGITGPLKRVLGSLLQRRRFSTLFGIGFFNGLLPCGLVYLGIAGAVATGSIWKGALFMAAFGAGTLPAMAAVTWFSHLVSLRVRSQAKKVLPFVVIAMALLLIMRGMNLGIPYISPIMQPQHEQCCHKH